MLLHAIFISSKFSVSFLVIVPLKPKCISCFSYMSLFANFTLYETDKTLIVTTSLWFIWKVSAVTVLEKVYIYVRRYLYTYIVYICMMYIIYIYITYVYNIYIYIYIIDVMKIATSKIYYSPQINISIFI